MGKFKLKPKVAAPPAPEGAAPAPAAAPPAAPKFPPPPGLAKSAPPPPPPAAASAPKLPPPFPVVAPPATGKTTPPIPHISVAAGAHVVENPVAAKPEQSRRFKMGVAAAGLAALLVLGGGGYFAWTKFISPPPPPPPVAAKPKPAAPLTPSDTLNTLAHAPVNAINKAQDAVAARRGSEQSRIDAMAAGQDAPDKRALNTPPPSTLAAGGATKEAAPATKLAATSSARLAPGIMATNSDIEAVAEATPAFRTFVANAKITGVIGGTPAKIILNGRLARSGDMIDPGLGISFESIDAEKKLLVFKDKSGAVVTRKF